ncbi:MAG: NAD(P)H-dependent oxidoreductase subunit E [Deltaproteobacteria bacterium]|nr:NAD(P)H-dependent oxidoreductase subunit E [Deltaproteobacteria bacterium]
MSQSPITKGDRAAGLLTALHEAQARDGFLRRETLEKLAAQLKVPIADIYSAATFYHYFSFDEQRSKVKGRCGGPVCSLPGMAKSDPQEMRAIACPGLCDQPVAEYSLGRFFADKEHHGVFRLPESVDTEQVLFRGINSNKPQSLKHYRENGGFDVLLRLLNEADAGNALDELKASGLVGRGGAGFPLAQKWQAARSAGASPKYVICNADEGEPGTFKDRPLIHLQPHLLLEAMAICGYLVGAGTGIIYLRYEYPEALEVLRSAIEEAEGAGLLGADAGGSGFAFEFHIARGAGSYVCGEETALLNSLEGHRPWPRERPPFPTTEGLWGKPTVINNVETLCSVPAILARGAGWYRSLGKGENAGTKIYSVSGKVKRPGNYELPLGITARELIFSYAGGPAPDHTVKGFTLGGISGGMLSAASLELSLDYHAPQKQGVFLGSGGVVVLDDSCCVVDFARACMLFYESESCGKCYPCRIGTVRLRELLDGLTGRALLPRNVLEKMEEIGSVMMSASACGLGQSAPLVVKGAFKFFSDEVKQHLEERRCPAGICFL